MKSNLLRTFFEWALITSVLMSVGFLIWFVLQSRAARAYSVQVTNAQAHFNSNHAFLSALGGECQEYAKGNPEFARFLSALSQQPAPAASSKPVPR
jgi:hypothetical protein